MYGGGCSEARFQDATQFPFLFCGAIKRHALQCCALSQPRGVPDARFICSTLTKIARILDKSRPNAPATFLSRNIHRDSTAGVSKDDDQP